MSDDFIEGIYYRLQHLHCYTEHKKRTEKAIIITGRRSGKTEAFRRIQDARSKEFSNKVLDARNIENRGKYRRDNN